MSAVGTPAAPTIPGIGWVDVRTLRRSFPSAAVGGRVMAGAVGPGGDALIERRRALGRAARLDLLVAHRLTSLAYSYTMGLRIDGVRAAGVRRLLARSRPRQLGIGAWKLLDAGEEGQVPPGARTLGALGARTAFHDRSVLLARSDDSRASLLGHGEPLVDDPPYDFAARCLGNVFAARILPAFFLRSAHPGIDLVAVGVSPARQEVLCAVGRSPDAARAQATALGSAFAPGTTDPVTGRRMRALVSRFRVEQIAEGDLHASRAQLVLARPEDPGLLFRALTSGGVLDYLGSRQRPPHG
jgi:hypothetical protein